MGKTIFAAIVAAAFTSIATVLIMNALATEKAATEAKARESAAETEKVERERLDRRLADVERRVAAVPRVERRAEPSDAPAVAPAAAPAVAPDGTPYVSQAQMEAFAKAHGVHVGEVAVDGADVKPIAKKTLEEIARDQGLSAGEEANVRNILRESEEELVHCLFGSKSIDEIKAELVAVKADPEKQSELMQTVVQNGINNVGKLMTLEKRTKKRVDDVLGPERGKKFMDTPRQPLLAPEFEDIFKDFGD